MAESDASISLDSRLTSVIQDYLSVQDDVNTVGFGGRNFVALTVLGIDKVQNGMKVYVWVVSREFYLENGALQEGSASSLPVALTVENSSGSYRITSHQIPQDGSFYSEDVKKIFPDTVAQKVFNFESNNIQIQNLLNQTLKQANEYFSSKTN